jgi:hypothetical protein
MKKIFLTILIMFVSVSVAFGASTKVSELTETTTLTDDDIFLVSTYLTGNYTSKFIKTQYLKTILQPYDSDLTTYAGITPSANVQSLLGSADYAAMRTNLSLVVGTNIQAYDAELTALAGLTSAANAIPYFTGSGTAGVISSSADMVALLDSADYATALTKLGGWGVSGSITDEQLVCAETTGGSNLLKSCGAKTTINAGNSTLLCKDSSGEVEACGGVTISGTTSPVVNVNPQEVDAHTTSTNLTAAQVSNTIIHNYDQGASDVFTILPAAAAGYSFLVTITTAQSNHFCVEADADDKIYLISAAGTVAAGNDGAGVCMMAAQVGQSFACWTFKSGASTYDWQCKAIAIGTSTFEAHASSE